MAVVLPVTSLFLGIHAIYFAVISFRVGIYRGQNMQKNKNYEQAEEFKHRNAVGITLLCSIRVRMLRRSTDPFR